MTEAVVDPISASRDLVAAELGTDVPGFAHELPDGEDASMPRKCFVVSGSGGPSSGGFLPLGRQRLDFRFYGATHAEAMDIAIAAHRFLKALRRTVAGAVLVHGFDAAGGYLTLRDGDGRWPLVLRSYLGLFDEREVA